MKQRINTWALYCSVTLLFVAALLLVLVLNPVLTYAHKTTHHQYNIFHHLPLDPTVTANLDKATLLLRHSEFYHPELTLDICLHDGSVYPQILRALRGRAFGWGLYNKVILQGHADYAHNAVELNGYTWNFTQLIAHEAIHCFQFNALGFWKTNPVAQIPVWKFEGYPEYIARQHADQTNLAYNIARLLKTEQTDNNDWIQFADSTGTVIPYYKYWLLVQYCMNIKQMTYRQVLADTTGEERVQQQMMHWYTHNQ